VCDRALMSSHDKFFPSSAHPHDPLSMSTPREAVDAQRAQGALCSFQSQALTSNGPFHRLLTLQISRGQTTWHWQKLFRISQERPPQQLHICHVLLARIADDQMDGECLTA